MSEAVEILRWVRDTDHAVKVTVKPLTPATRDVPVGVGLQFSEEPCFFGPSPSIDIPQEPQAHQLRVNRDTLARLAAALELLAFTFVGEVKERDTLRRLHIARVELTDFVEP